MSNPSPAGSAPRWSGSVELPHWGLIRASGPDAASFLHAQLTRDFASLGDDEVRLAGFCSAKGRLQASFVAWRGGPDELLLSCHDSVLAATVKRLSMFVLRSKCKLSDASSEAADAASRLVCSGLIGAAAERACQAAGLADAGPWRHRRLDGASLLRLPEVAGLARAVWVAGAGIAAPGADAATGSDEAPPPTLDNWCWLEVCSGMPTIEAETVDKFVPQMVNFELIGGVDFQKGCYPGQEVVARSQYRGTVKRRMFLFHVAGACAPGEDVFHSSDVTQPAGMVVNSAPRPGASGETALIEVKLASLDDGSLHLDGVDGPLLTRIELPYKVAAPSES
ncbi:YgfZ/GcvT domain-containing protein [Piscinibacter sakaiensis]|uniref:CAF17-like 4Fe-4S cluster assembly/insertion protein YgfZ n=1 Tax=Piscinibacter sakaiensis TaxID=1547922 RepID=UPI003AAFFC1F